MRLWTYHRKRPYFPVDTVSEIDWTKSYWWDYEEPGFRYREAIAKFSDLVGTKDFLWCYREEGKRFYVTGDDIEDKWQVDVPDVLAYYQHELWVDLLYSRSENWNGVIVEPARIRQYKDVDVVVKLPLPPGAATKCPHDPVRGWW